MQKFPPNTHIAHKCLLLDFKNIYYKLKEKKIVKNLLYYSCLLFERCPKCYFYHFSLSTLSYYPYIFFADTCP